MSDIEDTDETLVNMGKIARTVIANAARVAALGAWPERIATIESLLHRIPMDGKRASGMDAGLACALDLIPRDKQRLSAILHAAYTPEAIAQVRREAFTGDDEVNEDMDPDSETCWWLVGCAHCEQYDVGQEEFENQIKEMRAFAEDPERRQMIAVSEIKMMLSLFDLKAYPGVPFGRMDGCMQGAYLAGHRFATRRDDEHRLYYIGTVLPTLGLEDFAWSDAVDDAGRSKSGPVHGSTQFVKCADEDEFLRAIAIVRVRCA